MLYKHYFEKLVTYQEIFITVIISYYIHV